MAQEVEWVSLGNVELMAESGDIRYGLLSAARIFDTTQYKISAGGSEYHVIEKEYTARGCKFNAKAGEYYFNK